MGCAKRAYTRFIHVERAQLTQVAQRHSLRGQWRDVHREMLEAPHVFEQPQKWLSFLAANHCRERSDAEGATDERTIGRKGLLKGDQSRRATNVRIDWCIAVRSLEDGGERSPELVCIIYREVE